MTMVRNVYKSIYDYDGNQTPMLIKLPMYTVGIFRVELMNRIIKLIPVNKKTLSIKVLAFKDIRKIKVLASFPIVTLGKNYYYGDVYIKTSDEECILEFSSSSGLLCLLDGLKKQTLSYEDAIGLEKLLRERDPTDVVQYVIAHRREWADTYKLETPREITRYVKS